MTGWRCSSILIQCAPWNVRRLNNGYAFRIGRYAFTVANVRNLPSSTKMQRSNVERNICAPRQQNIIACSSLVNIIISISRYSFVWWLHCRLICSWQYGSATIPLVAAYKILRRFFRQLFILDICFLNNLEPSELENSTEKFNEQRQGEQRQDQQRNISKQRRRRKK